MQSVNLTSEERQVLLDYAAHMEKRSRHWHAWRWLAICCFVFGLILLLAVVRLSAVMRSAFELPPEALRISETARAEAGASALQLVVAAGNAQIAALRAEIYLVIRVYFVVGMGTALFAHAVSDWRRDQCDWLVVRLPRSVVSDERSQKDGS